MTNVPSARNREDLLLEERLAPRDHEIRALLADERAPRRRAFGDVDDDLRRVRAAPETACAAVRAPGAPTRDRARAAHEPIVGAERQHVEKPQDPTRSNLARDPLAAAVARGSRMTTVPANGRKRSQPPRQPLAVERRVVVTDEQVRM